MGRKKTVECRACGEEVEHPVCTLCMAKLVGPSDSRDRELREVRRLLALFAQNPLDPDPVLIKEICSYARR
jgi:hypothetical protein